MVEIKKLEEKINVERHQLNKLVKEDLGREVLLKKSCELDKLINDYYDLCMDENFD